MTTGRRWSVTASALGILLLVGGANGVAIAAPSAPASPAATDHPGAATGPTATEGLQRLIEGNQRFVAGTSKHPNQSVARRKELATGQHPFAVILGCSDSRVPAEVVFDQGLGDVFVIRVAGNIVAPDDLGSIEYAAHHLGTPLIVVLGHEGCGGVSSALLPDSVRARESQGIQTLLQYIIPSLRDIDPGLGPAERLHAAVEANVRQSVSQLKSTFELAHPGEGPDPTIVGAIYDLETGKVRWLK